MIVESMDYAKMCEEINRCADRLGGWIRGNQPKLRRAFIKSNRKFFVQYLPDGGKLPTMCVVFYRDSRIHLSPYYFTWMETNRGKYFYSRSFNTRGEGFFDMFTPHWVARYIERLHLDCTPLEAMVHYTKKLLTCDFWSYEAGNAPTKKLTENLEGSLVYKQGPEGFSVVDCVGNLYIHKTYLTPDLGLHQEHELLQKLQQMNDFPELRQAINDEMIWFDIDHGFFPRKHREEVHTNTPEGGYYKNW